MGGRNGDSVKWTAKSYLSWRVARAAKTLCLLFTAFKKHISTSLGLHFQFNLCIQSCQLALAVRLGSCGILATIEILTATSLISNIIAMARFSQTNEVRVCVFPLISKLETHKTANVFPRVKFMSPQCVKRLLRSWDNFSLHWNHQS